MVKVLKIEYSQPVCICSFCICGFNQLWIENIEKIIILGSSRKQNLNLSHRNNYLHGIYIVLGIIGDLETVWGM